MNQIRNYIEAMFSSLPKTQNVIETKLTMLENMEEKFEALLREGKSENEAMGIIFSSFGNMEELKAELGISETLTSDKIEPNAEKNTALMDEFCSFKKKFGIAIAIAVGCFILAAPLYLLLEERTSNSSPIAIFTFFLSIACGSGICIYFGIQDDKYKQLLHLDKGKTMLNETAISTLIASIIFPMAVIFYLIMGFFWNLWHPGWIIFPISAMIVGIIKSIAVYRNEK